MTYENPLPGNQLRRARKENILEPGYVNASISRGYTCLRLPGVDKESDGMGPM